MMAARADNECLLFGGRKTSSRAANGRDGVRACVRASEYFVLSAPKPAAAAAAAAPSLLGLLATDSLGELDCERRSRVTRQPDPSVRPSFRMRPRWGFTSHLIYYSFERNGRTFSERFNENI